MFKQQNQNYELGKLLKGMYAFTQSDRTNNLTIEELKEKAYKIVQKWITMNDTEQSQNNFNQPGWNYNK